MLFTTKSNTLSESDLRLITREFIMSDDLKIENFSDSKTMCIYIPLPELIQKRFETLVLEADDGAKPDITSIWCEYWIDADECHYMFHGDGGIYDVTKDFDCQYLNDIIRDKYKKAYEVS